MITGASAGVGRAVAEALASRGAKLGLLARSQKALEETAAVVRSLGGQAVVLPADVARADEVDAAADRLERTFGSADVWINNAMTSVFAPLARITPDEFRRVTEVTYLGYVYGTMAALRKMATRNRGVIIQVGSALSYRGIPLQSAYCGAKHAIQGFSESVRCELLHEKSGIRVTSVNLPAVNTPQFGWVKSRLPGRPQPVPPVFQPEVAAHAVVWAIENERRELNVGFPSTVAIVGNNLLPAVGDWYLARTGFQSQQRPERQPADRPDNLWRPVEGLHASHGDFDARSKTTSWQLALTTHRALVAALAFAIGLLGLAHAQRRRRRSHS